MAKLHLQAGDALIVTDVQNDFLPGGALAVKRGDEVVPVLNAYAERFAKRALPVFATRDWHPENHCSFLAQGGPWPAHCIAGTPGAAMAPGLALPPGTTVISKATARDRDAYSTFAGTDLAARLSALRVRRIFVGGLTTDYCVLNTVLDGLRLGYQAVVLLDSIRAVDVSPGDGGRAIAAMQRAGALFCKLEDLEP